MTNRRLAATGKSSRSHELDDPDGEIFMKVWYAPKVSAEHDARRPRRQAGREPAPATGGPDVGRHDVPSTGSRTTNMCPKNILKRRTVRA
jgi:hypothetical protein